MRHITASHDAQAPVWVLEDAREEVAVPALAIAERLGVPFRRLGLRAGWLAYAAGLVPYGLLAGLAERAVAANGTMPGPAHAAAALLAAPRDGEGPRLVLSAGARAAGVALWLKAGFGCRVVQCLRPGLRSLLRPSAYDLLVLPAHENPPALPNVLPVLGLPHLISPFTLHTARAAWAERLEYLPRPRVALLVGGGGYGPEMPPALAHALARRVARLAGRQGGAVLACTSRHTGAEASDALDAGLGCVMHLLHRWGEPGEDPWLGFLACADAVVVTADALGALAQACATEVPVYAALPELASPRQRPLLGAMLRAGQVRMLGDALLPLRRTPLDEAGRVAQEVLRRFPLE